MIYFKKSFLLKILAVFLVSLLAFQTEYLFSQTVDPLQENFTRAKTAYLAGDYQAAKTALEGLLEQMEGVSGRDTLKGEANLLLGATLEKLQSKDPAIKHYCEAKRILGEGKGIEGIDLASLEFYREPCPTPPPAQQAVVVQEDAYALQFKEARTAFFAGNFQLAKAILEKLIQDITKEPGRDTLKGEIFLLTGATYEHLKYKELSFKYFCLAKQILGKGTTIEGLDLKPYKQYKPDCPLSQAYTKVKKKGGFGKFLGTLLILGILAVGGYFLYTKVIKKPAKGKYTSITLHVDVTFKGLNSVGTRILTLGSEIKNNENFTFTQNWNGSTAPLCEDMQTDKTVSFDVIVTGDSIAVKQEYLNWDYIDVKPVGTSWKALCAEWNFSISNYKWESGKSDPGSPSIEGAQDLELDLNSDCIKITQRIDNCTTNATLRFVASGSTSSPKQYRISHMKTKKLY